MALNPYFTNGTTSEKKLHEKLIIEAIQIYGIDVYYVPRKIINKDVILTEETFSSFDDAYRIEMYLQNMDSFDGEGDLLSRFGFEIRDEATFIVSNLRWNELIGAHGYDEDTVMPQAGDLIYMPMNKNIFEIKHVENELPFYQLQNLPTYTLSCELFRYESQEIDTGVPGLDETQTNNAYRNIFEIDTLTGEPTVGETLIFTLPDGETGSTEFFEIEVDPINNSKDLIVGPLTFDGGKQLDVPPGTVFTGVMSGAIIKSAERQDVGDPDIFKEDLTAQNSEFHNAAMDFIDFSVDNPFGDPL